MNSKPFFINKPANAVQDDLTDRILKNSNSREFHASLPGYEPTPLVELKDLAAKLGIGKLWLKDESARFGLNAFKGLGASYAIYKLLEENPDIETFCTATDGNHGRSVAWSAKLFGKKAMIYVPKDTTRHRIEAIESEGAIVEKLDVQYDATCSYAAQMSRKNGWQLVQDTAWEGYEEIPALIKAGYLTHFEELESSLHSLPEAKADVVFLQAGVGSWPAAAAWYYQNRYGKDHPKLVIVEPKAASGILESFRQGTRSNPTGNQETMMAGLNCGIPSFTAWEILKGTVDAAMEIDDEAAGKAIKTLYFPAGNDQRVVSGESGVGGFAGFLALMTDPLYRDLKTALGINESTNILVYSTEGATDPDNFERIISGNQ